MDFSGGGGIEQATTVEVAAGSNQDVVLHLPASVGGEALVTTYPAPVEPIGPGKARVLVAHTATVAPADIQVDGKVVFENVANGEFATADVPAGEHVVALFPTGETSDPILGPLTVDLAPRSLTMVYAVGNPETDSMDLVAHTAELAADGTLVPQMIDTGSAGLAARRTGDAVRTPGPLRSGSGRWAANGYGVVLDRHVAPALVAVVVAAAGMAWGLNRLGPGPPPEDDAALDVSGRSSATASPSTSPATPARRAGSVSEAPTHVRLPSGTDVDVDAVSTTSDGLLDVPDDIRTAGWWRGGSRIGDPFGSTLIAAHIDSRTQGLGPYAELLRVERGARIVVRSRHLVQQFAVTSLRVVPRSSLAKSVRPLRTLRPTTTDDGDMRGSVRRRARRVPEPCRRDGPPGHAARVEGLSAMTRLQGLSSRQAHPRRMPAKTHWRTVEPLESSDPPAWVEHRIPQAVRAPSGDRPDVTTRAWIRWAEAQMRQERALAADRAADEALRVPVDREPADTRAEPVKERRMPILVGMVSVAVALALVLGAVVWWWGDQPDPDTADRAQSVSAEVAAPHSPVALPADGDHVLIRVLGSGDLAVEQWVRRADGRGSLMLVPPDGIRVGDLSVVAGSRQVEVPTSLAAPTEITFPAGATLYLRYRLSGALELSDDDRALARATSVTFGEEPASQTVDFVGATVLSLACTPLVGDALPVPCGADAGVNGWRVVPPPGLGDVRVMAQLDLTLG